MSLEGLPKLIQFEEEIKRIKTIYSEFYSSKLLLFHLCPLLIKIIETNNPLIQEVYLTELTPIFINTVKNTSLEGISPEPLKSICKILSILNQYEYLKQINLDIDSTKQNIEKWLDKLNIILSGQPDIDEELNIKIPLLETSKHNHFVLGILESLSVKITKRKNEDEFIIVPSEKDIEKLLDEQIKTSWSQAKIYCHKFVRGVERVS